MDRWHADVDLLRAEQPVVRAEFPGFRPFWALTRHADVFEVSRDSERFLNTSRSVLADDVQLDAAVSQGLPEPASLVHLDGEKHRKHRAVTNDWFKPAAVGQRQPLIDGIADEFIDKMRVLGGSCDFAQEIAAPYTLRVIMSIYGVPPEDEALMLELTQGVFGAADPEYVKEGISIQEAGTAAIMQFIQYFNGITADRRACPADDLATVIANGEIDGCPMEDLERIWYYIIVATAGHDTTSYALAGGVEQLARHPEQFAALKANPDLIVNATEEIIRWTTPVRHFLRYAQCDVELGGVLIPKGERVLLSYPAANRDPEVFADPQRFDITRRNADRLISFGLGAHYCLGAQFARREIRTMLGRLVENVDSIQLDGDPEWTQSHFVSGVKHLPLGYLLKT